MAETEPERSRRLRFRDLGQQGPNHPTYELFIGFLTILSIGVVFVRLFVPTPQVDDILTGTDSLLCVIFLFDTFRSWFNAPDRSAYVFGAVPGRTIPDGIVDFIGSIPGVFALRVFRLFRLRRVSRDLRGREPGDVVADLVERRAQVAGYLVATAAILVMLVGSSVMAYVEPNAPGSNIKTGGDAFWWAFVTITTVGYGDRYPVTPEGRFVGMLTMAVGIGIFGVLTSFLAQWFLRRPHRRLGLVEPAPEALDESYTGFKGIQMPDLEPAAPSEPIRRTSDPETAQELRALREEIAELRRMIGSLTVEESTE
jgi:voltage-gated potassium channel